MKIPFLCTGNSCRSQMAEAWYRRVREEIRTFVENIPDIISPKTSTESGR